MCVRVGGVMWCETGVQLLMWVRVGGVMWCETGVWVWNVGQSRWSYVV